MIVAQPQARQGPPGSTWVAFSAMPSRSEPPYSWRLQLTADILLGAPITSEGIVQCQLSLLYVLMKCLSPVQPKSDTMQLLQSSQGNAARLNRQSASILATPR